MLIARLDGTPLVDIIRELRADPDGCARRLRAAGHDLDEAAANVVWNFLNQVYATGVFHGDLHPANVLLLDGNRIGYVDFGIVGRLSSEVQQSLGDYARSLFGGDSEAAVDQLLRWARPSARTELARVQVELLSAARTHRLSADPLIVLYMKVVLAMDAVTTELAPSLNVPVGARALLLRARHRGPAERLLIDAVRARPEQDAAPRSARKLLGLHHLHE